MYENILDCLPYKSSFRFVDNIISVDENGVSGNFTLKENAFFYEDHFAGFAVTPGAIITEIMVQIGLVVLGIYLMLNLPDTYKMNTGETIYPLLTSTNVSFNKMVLPGEKVNVISKKQYFRFNKLKCYVEMFDEKHEMIARGMFAGMIKKSGLKNSV